MAHDRLVTGCAGFIGYAFCIRLLEEGASVIGIDTLNSYYSVALKKERLKQLRRYPNFRFHHVDVGSIKGLDVIFRRAQIRQVFHFAGQAGVRYSMTHPRSYGEANVTATLNLFEICAQHGTIDHLIFISSSSVYGDVPLPYREEVCADKPLSIYAATKRAGELLAYSYSTIYKMPITCVRPFTVYGPWGRPDMAVYSFTRNILENKEIKLYNNGDNSRDFNYIDDVVEAISRLSPMVPPAPDYYRIINVGGQPPLSVNQLVEKLETILGRKARRKYVPAPMSETSRTQADIVALTALTGYRPAVAIDTGLLRFVEWYKEYHHLS